MTKFTEAESKETHGVWDPMPELTITTPYVHSSIDSNTFNSIDVYLHTDIYLQDIYMTRTKGNPIPESTLTLCQTRLSSRYFGFGLWTVNSVGHISLVGQLSQLPSW